MGFKCVIYQLKGFLLVLCSGQWVECHYISFGETLIKVLFFFGGGGWEPCLRYYFMSKTGNPLPFLHLKFLDCIY